MVYYNRRDNKINEFPHDREIKYMKDLDKMDADVLVYESAGPKRVRLGDEDSEKD